MIKHVETPDIKARLWLVIVLALVIAMIALLPLAARAQTATTQSTGHQTIVVLPGQVGALAAATLSGASFCIASIEGGPIRYWYDGSVPTFTSGHLTAAGANAVMPSPLTAAGFTFTTASMTPSVAQVSCFKGGLPSVFVSSYDSTQASSPTYSSASAAPALPLPQCNAVRTTGCQK